MSLLHIAQELDRIASSVKWASAQFIEVGDVVEALTKKGWKTGIISEVTYKPRSRAPYEIRYVTDDGQDFRGKRVSNRYDDPANQKIMRFKSKSTGSKLIQESIQRKEDHLQKKQDRAEAGAATLESWDLKKGDIIRYQYNNGIHQEIVAGVNYLTGKVGIERFKNDYDKQSYLKRLQDRREHKEMMEYFYGLSSRGTRDTSVRWLPGVGVIEVVKRLSEGGS